MLWNVLSRRMPALLITMSTRPNASSAVFTIAAPPSGEATECVSATAMPPRLSISFAAVCAGPSEPPVPSMPPPRSLMTTWAPRRREQERVLAAEAAARARDDRNLAVETEVSHGG